MQRLISLGTHGTLHGKRAPQHVPLLHLSNQTTMLIREHESGTFNTTQQSSFPKKLQFYDLPKQDQ